MAPTRLRSLVRRVGLVVAGLVVLSLALDALVGVAQPALEPGDAEAVLRTFDADGAAHETRLIVIEDEGTLWIQSGHHFRGWYHRLADNPEVELVRGGEVRAYHAVPLDTLEAREHMESLLKRRTGSFGFYLIRTFLLFADVKPVRLDPARAGSGSLPGG